VRPEVPDYTTVDLNLRSPRHPQWGRWSLSVRNLFDARVQEPSWYSPNSRLPVLIQNDLPQAGRAVMLQWQYSL
jgi:iron complex outermembrane receptor protein